MARKEDTLQAKCVLWFNRSYPDQRNTLFWVPNELIGKSTGWTKATCKSLGLVSGVSDLIWMAPCARTLAIEFKTAQGSQSPKQRQWQQTIEASGHEYHIVHNIEEFQQLVINTISNATETID